jgi:pilus assembly protein Flp/PilA
MNGLIKSSAGFLCEDDGSQVVEYALVIALLTIVLALALNSVANGLASTFQDLANTVKTCFTSSSC